MVVDINQEDKYELELQSPILETLFEPVDEPEIEQVTSFPEYQISLSNRKYWVEYSKNLRFDVGCSVVLKTVNPSTRIEPIYWGFVMDVVSWMPNVNSKYAPIECRWLDNTVSYHFPTELIVVQYAPDDIELGQIIKGGA